jgi:hypothetical protein
MPDSDYQQPEPEELDEFTAYRLKRIAKIFCEIHKAKGRKAGARYLGMQSIREEHYPTVRKHIQDGLENMGLTI